MPRPIIRPIIFSIILGAISISAPLTSEAASTGQINSQAPSITAHFTPRPSLKTRLDFDTWDFMLSETVLYMGPSTRTRPRKNQLSTGTRISRSHTSSLRLEGNKILYALMEKGVKSEMKSYAEELIELGNRLDIPSLPKNEQLAYWINLHNAVLITTISDNYPGPKRHPSLIEPVEGSEAKLHDAKFIKIDNYTLSFRDIREKIVFPNWKNGDVPYAFHLGYLGSPSMANVAYNGTDLREQLARNAYEYVNSLRGYDKGEMSPYIREVASWYYPNQETDLDNYFQKRMRPEVYAEFKANGIKTTKKAHLIIADMTAGYGKRGGMERYYANIQSTGFRSVLGTEINEFLQDRALKNLQLNNKEWFKRGTVTIEDVSTDGVKSDIE